MPKPETEKGLVGPTLLAVVLIAALGVILYKTYSVPKRSYADWVKIVEELEPGICEANVPEEYLEHTPGIRQYKTNDGTITIILCGVYAYQEASMAVYSDAKGENHEIMIFRQFINPSETFGTRIPLGLEYDKETQIFTTFAKGRGTGDCGGIGKHLFSEETHSVQVVEYRAKECDDQAVGQDEEPWPLIFSAPGYPE